MRKERGHCPFFFFFFFDAQSQSYLYFTYKQPTQLVRKRRKERNIKSFNNNNLFNINQREPKIKIRLLFFVIPFFQQQILIHNKVIINTNLQFKLVQLLAMGN
jgi:hypothetical protein